MDLAQGIAFITHCAGLGGPCTVNCMQLYTKHASF